jgi:hypothetical protein
MVPDSDVTVGYRARFSTLLVFGFDYKHKPEAWHHSLTLLQQEVMPRLKHLNAGLERAA